MTLRDLREWFRSVYGWSENIYIGKIDNDKDRALCFYNSRLGNAKIGTIGGKTNKDYECLPITILLRWGTNAAEAEKEAKKIYDFLDEKIFELNEKRAFVIFRYDNPIDLGTDDKGIYEYSFEFDVYYQK